MSNLTLEIMNGPSGPGYYLEDYRIAGNKQYGGSGATVFKVEVSPTHLMEALSSSPAGKAALAEYVRKAIQNGSAE